jgi:hypothetical protein
MVDCHMLCDKIFYTCATYDKVFPTDYYSSLGSSKQSHWALPSTHSRSSNRIAIGMFNRYIHRHMDL